MPISFNLEAIVTRQNFNRRRVRNHVLDTNVNHHDIFLLLNDKNREIQKEQKKKEKKKDEKIKKKTKRRKRDNRDYTAQE